MNEWIRAFMRAAYPRRCPGCGTVISGDRLFCEECASEVKKAPEFCGVSCAEADFIEAYAEVPGGNSPFCAAYLYDGKARKGLLQLKFYQKKQYAENFAQAMADGVRDNFKGITFDLITCVPMSRSGQKQRGYNQSALLAGAVADLLGIPYRSLLVKQKQMAAQHLLTAQERRENVKNAFGVKSIQKVHNKVILLCDDVITTGATMEECARVLRNAGASMVFGVAAAYTPAGMGTSHTVRNYGH